LRRSTMHLPALHNISGPYEPSMKRQSIGNACYMDCLPLRWSDGNTPVRGVVRRVRKGVVTEGGQT
jgi:hypothetical protein